MKDVMVDLETLDNVPGGVILSIGAVFFDWETRTLGPRYYCVVNRMSCAHYGLSVSSDTLAWWERQSKEARSVLQEATEGGVSLPDALTGFAVFLNQHHDGRDNNGKPSVNVWGNGSDFDNAFLQVAYARIGRELPWNFWRNESFRTLKNRVGKRYYVVPKPALPETAHNALDDAIHQARHACELLYHLDRAESVYESATLTEANPGQTFANAKTGVQMRLPVPYDKGEPDGKHVDGLTGSLPGVL